MISVDLSKQQAIDANLKVIQQISFTENLDWAGTTTILLILVELAETIFDFLQRTLRALWMCSINLSWFEKYQHKQYNGVNIKLSYAQFNKLKSATKWWSYFSNDDAICPRELLSTDRKVSKLWKTFANILSANINLSKTRLSKIIESRGFLDRLWYYY